MSSDDFDFSVYFEGPRPKFLEECTVEPWQRPEGCVDCQFRVDCDKFWEPLRLLVDSSQRSN